MFRLPAALALVAAIAAASPAAASPAPSSESNARPKYPSIAKLTARNTPGKHLSVDSRLSDVTPCTGASVTLRPIWKEAARVFDLKWQILAGITKVETDLGCNLNVSSAGATGWTQFMPATWKDWGMDGDGDGKADPMNAVDAVFSTARYLRVTGAPGDYYKAIFAYNHADWYVKLVLEKSKLFGKVSAGDYDDLSALARKGARLQEQLAELQEDIDHGEADLRHARKVRRRAQHLLDSSRDLLQRRQAQLEGAQERVDVLTGEYVSLTQGVAIAPGSGAAGGDDDLLRYATDADMQDAVLIYGAAASIMNRQTDRLAVLREAATKAGKLHTEVQGLVSSRTQALTDRSESERDARKLLRSNRRALGSALEKLSAYRSTLRSFDAVSGGQTSMLDFADPTSQADPDRPGDLRWPVGGRISSEFSSNRCLQGTCRPHQGVDIVAPEGKTVRASGDGRVSLVQSSGASGGYGNFVCVAHSKTMETCYAHLSEISVRPNEQLKQGEMVGRSGCTGRCFGAHVHFEVRVKGTGRNPRLYLP